jgi:hypothetical protein
MTAQEAKDLTASTSLTLNQVLDLITEAAVNGYYTTGCKRLAPEVVDSLKQLGYTVETPTYNDSQITWML